MKATRVSANMYKRFFIILLCVFAGVFAVEFIACMLGNPISEITFNDTVIIPNSLGECMLYAAVASSFVGGIVNVFLTIRVIKEALGLSHWPAVAVVVMTLLFPIELLLGALFVLPNIIIFGLKGRS